MSGVIILNTFLKWPGGKRWLLHDLEKYINIDYNRYFEPFVGGGAVLFFLNPPCSTISDINSDLINLYIVMRDNTEELKAILQDHQKKHNKSYYYKIRALKLDDPIEKAGQMLYLNRACFNGMFRVNQKGDFNVPIGTKSNFVYDLHLFEDYSNVLKKCNIINSDFESIINDAQKNDLIFADPPYVTNTLNNGFIKYNEKLFTWDDQNRLLDSLVRARDRGSIIISTNAYFKELVDMYINAGFKVQILSRKSTISGKKESRQETKELFITSI